MTEEKLIAAAHHMAESREQFVKELHLVMEAFVSFSERLRTFGAFLDNRDEIIKARIEYTHEIGDSLHRLVDTLSQNTIALRQNSERMDKLVSKMESYFGDGIGLEHEN
jgi:hypothetical protein